MFVLLNGSFGIGKTTTANGLVAMLGSASIYDPEPVGIAIQRASALLGSRIDDFQDVAIWRRLTAWAAGQRHRRATIVIVPMAFSNLGYFEALVNTLQAKAPVQKLCLVAPFEVVEGRLEERAKREGKTVDPWVLRRAKECSLAHQSEEFGRRIDATPSTANIARAILACWVTYHPFDGRERAPFAARTGSKPSAPARCTTRRWPSSSPTLAITPVLVAPPYRTLSPRLSREADASAGPDAATWLRAPPCRGRRSAPPRAIAARG